MGATDTVRTDRLTNRFFISAIAALAVSGGVTFAQDQFAAASAESIATTPEADNELADLSLDQLMNVDVTSVAGVKQEFFKTPAAIYVLRPDDIANAGHLSIAESLRLVPGVHVARTSSNIWAVSTRGFNGRLANQQLVLVDGRVVYDPFFAGVFWDIQQPILADLDRVEVIRGPGATLWGGNAVNGVININTLSARDTQGLHFDGVAGVGDVLGAVNLRYGGKLSEDAYYRVYGQFLNFDNHSYADGSSAEDNWHLLKGGVRMDFGKPGEVVLTVAGEAYGTERVGGNYFPISFIPGVESAQQPVEYTTNGGHLLTRLAKETGDSGWQLQFIIDHFERNYNGLTPTADVFDLDWRAHFKPDSRNEIVWGLGTRVFHYDTSRSSQAQYLFDPEEGTKTTVTAFVQNTYAIVPDRLYAMLGSKFEHNDYTGFEMQPSIRAWWTPDDRHTVWTAVSRSLRVPALLDEHLAIQPPFPNAPPVQVGSQNPDSTVAWTYELGYRQRIASGLTVDVSSYYSDYSSISTLEPSFGATQVTGFQGEGITYGLETSVSWQPVEDLNVTVGYAYGREVLTDNVYFVAPSMPEHMVHLGADWRVTKNVSLNAHTYYVDDWFDGVATVDSYVRLDLGLRWQINENCELALWGQNLLDDQHPESSRGSAEGYGETTEIGRSAYVQFSYHF